MAFQAYSVPAFPEMGASGVMDAPALEAQDFDLPVSWDDLTGAFPAGMEVPSEGWSTAAMEMGVSWSPNWQGVPEQDHPGGRG